MRGFLLNILMLRPALSGRLLLAFSKGMLNSRLRTSRGKLKVKIKNYNKQTIVPPCQERGLMTTESGLGGAAPRDEC